jgi:replicative superfamily II helicase
MKSTFANIRIISVSATIPNISSIANWISTPDKTFMKLNTAIKVFGENYRPVPLKKIVVAQRNNSKNPFIFEQNLNHKIPELIKGYSNSKPTLIFCTSRKAAQISCKFLSESTNGNSLGQLYFPFNILDKVQDSSLKSYLVHGIGYHHAGLGLQDKHIVENLFREGRLPILCKITTATIKFNLIILVATSTLAVGV